jgi:starvation-inducible outer membrane lipoprotein
MKYSFLIFFTLAGCAHTPQEIEKASDDDMLDTLSEDELEDLPESGNNDDDSADPQENKK